MFTILSGRDVVDAIMHMRQKSKQNSIERKIYDKILDENILICPYCCGFVDKTSDDCPHCYKQVGLLNNETLAINIKEFSEEKVSDFLNEGKYIGRYSRGEETTLEN